MYSPLTLSVAVLSRGLDIEILAFHKPLAEYWNVGKKKSQTWFLYLLQPIFVIVLLVLIFGIMLQQIWLKNVLIYKGCTVLSI